MALLEAARVIYIDKIEPSRAVRMITRIGASNPVHCTSVGKAILAFLPPERAAEVLKRIRFERTTQRTIATPEALRTELEKTRRRGYAVDDEELEEGLRCIAGRERHSRSTGGVRRFVLRALRNSVRRLAIVLARVQRVAHISIGAIPRPFGHSASNACPGSRAAAFV